MDSNERNKEKDGGGGGEEEVPPPRTRRTGHGNAGDLSSPPPPPLSSRPIPPIHESLGLERAEESERIDYCPEGGKKFLAVSHS